MPVKRFALVDIAILFVLSIWAVAIFITHFGIVYTGLGVATTKLARSTKGCWWGRTIPLVAFVATVVHSIAALTGRNAPLIVATEFFGSATDAATARLVASVRTIWRTITNPVTMNTTFAIGTLLLVSTAF